jgi:hypothetical protein
MKAFYIISFLLCQSFLQSDANVFLRAQENKKDPAKTKRVRYLRIDAPPRPTTNRNWSEDQQEEVVMELNQMLGTFEAFEEPEGIMDAFELPVVEDAEEGEEETARKSAYFQIREE